MKQGLLRISCGGLVLTLLALGAWGPNPAAGGPIIKQRAESELEIDLGMIVDDFAPLLGELAAAEDETAPEKVRALLDLLGLNALDRLHVRSSLDDERGVASMTLTLDPATDGGWLADTLAIPSTRFGFGRYLRKEETALVLYMAGIGERIGAIERMFARPEMRQLVPLAPTDPLGITAMWGVDMRKEILPHLSGELDLILFPCRDGQPCEIPNVALVLGLTDGPAFREVLLNILTQAMGEEQGAELRAVEGDTVGEFTFYPAWPGFTYAIASNFGIMTTDIEGIKSLVGRRGGGEFPAVEATTYVRANGDLLLAMLSGVLEKTAGDSAEAELIAGVLRAVGDEPIGTIEMTSKTGKGRMEMEFHVPASLYAAEYRFLKEFFAVAPQLQALQSSQSDLQGIVHGVDEALTRYGQEHDGTFPEDLEELVESGYLEALPDLVPTPLGQYLDGGYTYLPLHDETGAVIGHYFFVYGNGEHSGHDVFTEENLADPENFRVGTDGENDGVAGFSYDGIALDHVQEWGGN